MDAFIAAFTLFLTFLPSMITRKRHINLPPSFQVVIILFIFAANYLGELKLYYERYWWWDKMLHALSGLMLGFAGYLFVYIINREKKLKVSLSPLFIAMFSFTFALSIGTLWEIYEYIADSFFGFNMQRSGLVDTMRDLIIDAISAFIASFACYVYEKNKADGIIKRIFTNFVKFNRSLFDEDNMSIEKNKLSEINRRNIELNNVEPNKNKLSK